MTTVPPRPGRVRRLVGIVLLTDKPFWRSSWSRVFAQYAVLACYVYFGAFVALLALEDRLLYPGATFARAWREPADDLNFRELTLDSADGERIHAWFSAPKGWQPQRGALLYSHGNGNNLSRFSDHSFRWGESLGRAVLIYDYPGYGKSTGWPSEKGCYTAGEAAFRWLVEERKVPFDEVILVGESLGGSIAVELATRHEVRMLVLHGAFTSFPDMAQFRVPCYPARYLVHNQMNNEAKIGHIHCPVLISHGTADAVVPFAYGERLFAAAHEPKQFYRLEGHGHSPPSKDEFCAAVKRFLVKTAR